MWLNMSNDARKVKVKKNGTGIDSFDKANELCESLNAVPQRGRLPACGGHRSHALAHIMVSGTGTMKNDIDCALHIGFWIDVPRFGW